MYEVVYFCVSNYSFDQFNCVKVFFHKVCEITNFKTKNVKKNSYRWYKKTYINKICHNNILGTYFKARFLSTTDI